MIDPAVLGTPAQNDGTQRHTGRFTVARKLANGTLVTVILPDDWQALVARVAALEAAGAGANSLEDLTYGG